MGKINLKRTLNSENCKKVAEQKSLGSCEKIVEPKVTMYDLDSLLDTSKDNHHVVISDNMKAKWDEILSVFDTPDETVDNPPAVVEPPIQKRKTSDAQLKATKKWNKKQYRMTLRISPELKVELDRCAMVKGISATKFIEQAIKEQIKRDNVE